MTGCTCTFVTDTGPDPVNEAEQDPFCLVHPIDLDNLATWVDGWLAGRYDPPSEEELVRACRIILNGMGDAAALANAVEDWPDHPWLPGAAITADVRNAIARNRTTP